MAEEKEPGCSVDDSEEGKQAHVHNEQDELKGREARDERHTEMQPYRKESGLCVCVCVRTPACACGRMCVCVSKGGWRASPRQRGGARESTGGSGRERERLLF